MQRISLLPNGTTLFLHRIINIGLAFNLRRKWLTGDVSASFLRVCKRHDIGGTICCFDLGVCKLVSKDNTVAKYRDERYDTQAVLKHVFEGQVARDWQSAALGIDWLSVQVVRITIFPLYK